MWTEGTIEGYTYYVKHYDEGSHYGINEGRVSKLEIRKNGKILVNYDRCWDVRPADAETKRILKAILKMYN